MQDQYTVSVGTKRLLERFEELWKLPHEISLEELKRIITNLPEVVQFTAKLFVKPTKSADSWNAAFSQSSARQTLDYRQQESVHVQQWIGGKSSLVA